MSEDKNEINERTMIKIPVALAITICLGLIGFGGVYYQTTGTHDDVEDLKIIVAENEDLDRAEREAIKKDFERDDEKLESRMIDFMKAEIDGLRADWDRDRKSQDDRINKLEK